MVILLQTALSHVCGLAELALQVYVLIALAEPKHHLFILNLIELLNIKKNHFKLNCEL